MKINNIILLITAVFVLNSCEQDATNVDLPYEPPRLVVHSFISPTDSLWLRLTTSAPVYNSINSTIKEINDAVVEFYIDENNPVILSNIGSGIYVYNSGSLNVVAGNTYKIKVSRNGYDQVTSECTVIEEPQFEISNEKINIKIGEWGDSTAVISVSLKMVNATEDSYYKIIPFAIYESIDYVDSAELYSNYYDSQFIKFSPNEVKTLKYETYYSGFYKFNKIRFVVLKPDDHYYKYHYSVENFSGDAIFTEPSLIYSNINNGYGVFCSYNRKDTVINLNYK